ncbi:hypothetical protein Hanom_Chr10g00959301 [Helianthus anomalus]
MITSSTYHFLHIISYHFYSPVLISCLCSSVSHLPVFSLSANPLLSLSTSPQICLYNRTSSNSKVLCGQ